MSSPSPPATAPSSPGSPGKPGAPAKAGSPGKTSSPPVDDATSASADRSMAGVSVDCPGCGKPLPQNGTACTHCGFVPDERLRCVHCGAVVAVAPSKDARFVCSRCNGVRIAQTDLDAPRSEEQIALLRRANVARNAKIIWTTVSGVVIGFGAFSALILALVASVADTGTGPLVAGALSVLATWAFGAVAAQRARRQTAAFRTLLDQAWTTARTSK